jgi:hypothetical protein
MPAARGSTATPHSAVTRLAFLAAGGRVTLSIFALPKVNTHPGKPFPDTGLRPGEANGNLSRENAAGRNANGADTLVTWENGVGSARS